MVSDFSCSSAVFKKSANVSRQELYFNHILKEHLIPKDLQIIRKNKKQKRFWSKILKRYYNTLGVGARQVQHTPTIREKQNSNFTSLVALIFPLEFDVLLFDFSPACIFFIGLVK